jgi:hypothetical protein
MATRYYITLGATTTAGGTVTTASSFMSINGVQVALVPWVVEERMKFVNRAAARFDELLMSRERPYVEESLRVISAGRGVA